MFAPFAPARELRGLHVFCAVVQSGAKAPRVKQPPVSKAIGDLEGVLGVRHFNRSPQGVRPTIYGDALIGCGVAVFQLKQGIGKIEFLSDPTTGEVRIWVRADGGTLLPSVIRRFSRQYPRAIVHVDEAGSPAGWKYCTSTCHCGRASSDPDTQEPDPEPSMRDAAKPFAKPARQAAQLSKPNVLMGQIRSKRQ
jgi:Bacterial regulatory helix-turn-helix protein, lysR family